MIIYDASVFDMYEDDNSKYLGNLRPYYHRNGIPDIFIDVDASEMLKMKSGLYRYNSIFFGLVGDNLHPIQLFDKGYWPNNNQMNYDPDEPLDDTNIEVDKLKIAYLHKFIALAREHGVPVVFIASPTWFGAKQCHTHDPIREICEKEKVAFIDDNYDEVMIAAD